jgi:hypothetical protein
VVQKQAPPPPARARGPSDPEQGSEELERLFDSLRSGAANVAGVTFQIATTAWVLAAGRADAIAGLPVLSVAPEGFEDIDCELQSGNSLLVQTKERGVGARALAAAEVATIISHAAPALGADRRFAILTNGEFGSSLPAGGFTSTLEEDLSARSDNATRATLIGALRRELGKTGLTAPTPESLLARTHLVAIEAGLAERTLLLIEHGLGVHPAVAALVRAELLRDLGEVAAGQRESSLGTVRRRALSDLELIATRVMQEVDVPSLEEAVAAGVCEAADYVSPSSVDAGGFFAGVDVVPAHVAAGFDVVRPDETAGILSGLSERRDVVIAGPSGSGKSALLWRAARLVDFGARVLRVLRIADATDVELLVRHVRRQKPTEAMRLLVVADDLGRDRMAAWAEARRRLREIPGALLLAAVRREDLTPEISASAVVIDPTMTESTAGLIFDALEAAGIPMLLARDEAVARADGLLMEFIALATTGRRLREVLASQLGDLDESDGQLRRRALRLVCAAHLLGSAVPADALPRVLGVDPDTAGAAMSRLAGEHLVVADGQFWHGLHDLRTEVLFELLHATPPPTIPATYAEALSVLPDAAQGPGARRAAVRIARLSAAAASSAHPDERLGTIQQALQPVAEWLRHELAGLTTTPGGDDTAARAAALLEAADRLDTAAYVHAVLPYVEKIREPTVDLATLANLAYSCAIDGLTFNGALEPVARLSRGLPKRRSACATAVAAALIPATIAGLATGATLPTAIRLLEATEGLATLTAELASEIYKSHVPSLPWPRGSTGTRADADRRAQLIATLAVLAEVRGPQVTAAFGPTEGRAADAVASDSYGCNVELSLVPAEPPAEAAEDLARPFTYSRDEMLVASAVAFARASGAAEPSAYPNQPGDTHQSINGQAVLLARRVFDACPEIDQVNVEIWQANCEPAGGGSDSTKSLRAGVLRRRPDIARNVAFQAGVAEALSADSWTRRLREQASIARSLLTLMKELPDRLRPHDNAGRQREWVRGTLETAANVAELPGRPAERKAVLGSARTETLHQPAATLDEELRAPDHPRAALELLSGAMQQVANNLDDQRMVRLAGFRFAEVPAKMRVGRAAGAPIYSGIGDTLPEALDVFAASAGRVLTALDTEAIDRALRGPRVELNRLDRLVEDTARAASSDDARIVSSRLEERGIPVHTAVILDRDPVPPWRIFQAVAMVDLERWPSTVEALQNWGEDQRSEAGLTGRAVALAVEDREILPMGLRFFATTGHALPLQEDDIAPLAEVLAFPLRAAGVRSRILGASEELVAYSSEQTRRSRRDGLWAPTPAIATNPATTAATTRNLFSEVLERLDEGQELDEAATYEATAAGLMLELCEAVELESGEEEGLAAQLAAIDFTALHGQTLGPLAQLFDAAHVAALEADRASRH